MRPKNFVALSPVNKRVTGVPRPVTNLKLAIAAISCGNTFTKPGNHDANVVSKSTIPLINSLTSALLTKSSRVAVNLLIDASKESLYDVYLVSAVPWDEREVSNNSSYFSQFSSNVTNDSCCLIPANAFAIAFLETLSRVFHFSAISPNTSSKSLNSKLVFLMEIPILLKTFSTSFKFSDVSVLSALTLILL